MRQIMRRHPLPHHVWRKATRQLVVVQGLDAVQMAHLRELARVVFAHQGDQQGAGLDVSLPMRVAVAAQACLLILNLASLRACRSYPSRNFSLPSFSIVLTISSPALSHTCLSLGYPRITPCGVPV